MSSEFFKATNDVLDALYNPAPDATENNIRANTLRALGVDPYRVGEARAEVHHAENEIRRALSCQKLNEALMIEVRNLTDSLESEHRMRKDWQKLAKKLEARRERRKVEVGQVWELSAEDGTTGLITINEVRHDGAYGSGVLAGRRENLVIIALAEDGSPREVWWRLVSGAAAAEPPVRDSPEKIAKDSPPLADRDQASHAFAEDCSCARCDTWRRVRGNPEKATVEILTELLDMARDVHRWWKEDGR